MVSSRSRLLRDDVQRACGKDRCDSVSGCSRVSFPDLRLLAAADREPRGIQRNSAERNRIKSLPILAPRGKILDRDGRVIVDNHSSFSLILSRENLKEEHLKAIAEGLNLDYDELVDRLRRFRQAARLTSRSSSRKS